ncbi:MAG TPA: PilZ domain-containing protein [Nitrospiraceae bacterium]|nr:PilZ domain-containing protein [Nitrospiraceae bacterium]
MSEGRKHHRIACRCPVNFSTDELDGTGLVYNLAVGGCAVETEQSVGDHGYISLTITLVPGCPAGQHRAGQASLGHQTGIRGGVFDDLGRRCATAGRICA